MHFSHQQHASGSQASKFALVVGLHVLIGFGVVNMMNTKVLPIPDTFTELGLIEEPKRVEPPPPPIEPPKPMEQVAPPDVVVPPIEIAVEPPPVENTVRAVVETEVKPEPALPVRTEVQTQAADKPVTNNGKMRSAVLADAKSCATPNYPPQAARNGDSGTVFLALLVGADGRVTSSRVTKTSGSRDLDRAAMNALSLCQFKPAMNNGVAEAGWAQIAYDWKLD